MNFFDKSLPKWPCLAIFGPNVAKELAEDIIYRTDPFLTAMDSFSGGNNTLFNSGYALLSGKKQVEAYNDTSLTYKIEDKVREKVGFIDLEYLGTNWASCAYIGGPNGFMSPEGKIDFVKNVGKWPSVEEIYQEFVKIAETWPELTFTASFYDSEEIELLELYLLTKGTIV